MEAKDFGMDEGAKGDNARGLVFTTEEFRYLPGDLPGLLVSNGRLLATHGCLPPGMFYIGRVIHRRGHSYQYKQYRYVPQYKLLHVYVVRICFVCSVVFCFSSGVYMTISRASYLKRVAFITALIALLAVVTQTAVPQEEPRPFPLDVRHELPYRPDLAVEVAPQSEAEVAAATYIPWSRVVSQSLRDGDWEIYTAADDGSGQLRLTNDPAADVHPRLNRGAGRVVFASDRDGDFEIFAVNVDGSGLVQLTSNSTDDVYPAWSPDGNQIAFQAYRDGQPEIYVMGSDGSNQTRLTTHGDYDGVPAWSPDGSKIAFSSRRGSYPTIHIMDANGGHVRQLSSLPYGTDPIWSPDGRRIAFSANPDLDRFENVWLLKLDENLQVIEEESVYTHDSWTTVTVWPTTWSPDGRYLGYTRLALTYFEGEWYWVSAALVAVDPERDQFLSLSNSELDWSPDWQGFDTQAPAATLRPLPAVSPGPIPVSWSGQDAGPAGLRSFDVQVKTISDAGASWQGWLADTMATGGSFWGKGGKSYVFRVRARDHAHNLSAWSAEFTTAVEALPPLAHINPLPRFTHERNITASWGGVDPGHSGIADFDVQFRVDGGDWENVEYISSETQLTFQWSEGAGKQVSFRVRARDRAQNQGEWSPEVADSATTLYRWMVSGVAADNGGAPISNIEVTLTPNLLGVEADDLRGQYAAYSTGSSGLPTQSIVAWSKDGYGALPPTTLTDIDNQLVDVALPPANNLMTNWDFEIAGEGIPGWQSGSDLPAARTDTTPHTGNFAVQQGPPSLFTTSLLSEAQRHGDGNEPDIVVDASGAAHIAYIAEVPGEPDRINREVRYTYQRSDGTWVEAENISGVPGHRHNLQIFADDTGAIHVVWRSRYEEYYYARRDLAGTWSSPERIGLLTDNDNPLSVQIDSQGFVHAVWTKFDSVPAVKYSRRHPDGTWEPPATLNRPGNPDQPYWGLLLLDHQDRPHVVWVTTYFYDERDAIYYTFRQSDGGWSPLEKRVTRLSGAVELFQAAVDQRGVVHVLLAAAVDSDTDNYLYHTVRRSNGWSPLFPVSKVDHNLYNGRTALATDGNNALHVVWSFRPADDRRGDRDIRHRRLDANGRWSDITIMAGGREIYPADIRLVDTDEGMVLFWWNQGFYLTYELPGGRWAAPYLVDSVGYAEYVDLAVTSSGQIHLAHLGLDESGSVKGLFYTAPHVAPSPQVSLLSQQMTVPVTITAPVLSFAYQIRHTRVTDDADFIVEVDDGSEPQLLTITVEADGRWHYAWANMSRWKGEAITISFRSTYTADQPMPQIFLDEVSLGTAHPDVWIAGSTTAAWPGETVTYRLSYGNQGGVSSAARVLTFTLPAEVSFVSASVPPLSTSPLTWAIDGLAAKSNPYDIEIIGMVSPSAAPSGVLVGTAAIQANGELETLNNMIEITAIVGRISYLPVAVQP